MSGNVISKNEMLTQILHTKVECYGLSYARYKVCSHGYKFKDQSLLWKAERMAKISARTVSVQCNSVWSLHKTNNLISQMNQRMEMESLLCLQVYGSITVCYKRVFAMAQGL